MINYETFLANKLNNAPPAGLDIEADALNPNLFDFQKAVALWALRRGKAALFMDTGLGKTLTQLSWADRVVAHTNHPVLILAPLGVTYQTVEEGAKFGIEVRHVNDGAEVDGPAIYITNYEKLHRFESIIDAFIGIVIDESSLLKSIDGKIRTKIIELFNRTHYRLACTATPAPNDHIELGNHAEFLGIMTRAEMLAMFFTHDGGDTSKWRLKGHAIDRFWKWVSTWAVMVRHPSDLGFSDDRFILPKLNYHSHVVDVDIRLEAGRLFDTGSQSLTERRLARRLSTNDRVAKCVELIKGSREQWLVWCDMNAEQNAIAKALGKSTCVSIQGSTPDDERLILMDKWRRKGARVLISKPSIFGFGLNFQFCHNVAFVGLSDSYEAFYQATRRVWRFGQISEVQCHVITSSAEGAVLQNIQRKEREATKMQDGMIEHMKDIGKAKEATAKDTAAYITDSNGGDGWEVILGDCVEVVGNLPTGSIGYSIYSPPFASLYTYSNSERDMGNCADTKAFAEHFEFLAKELFRIMQPGRLMSFHCMNLPTSKVRDGVIGIHDFRGDLIRIFEAVGFTYHSEVVIWKDPVTAMQRTKALGLLHKQIVKDSAMSRQGIPDYLVTMRKDGINSKPVAGPLTEYTGDDPTLREWKGTDTTRRSIDIWQRYASPVWMDIDPSDTLQYTTAREAADERHICPLQLQVIERGIQLWTMPGDLVLDPFTGIGSTGYVAVKNGRRFIGSELKKSYWTTAVRNLRQAELELKQSQMPLFAKENAI